MLLKKAKYQKMILMVQLMNENTHDLKVSYYHRPKTVAMTEDSQMRCQLQGKGENGSETE